MPARVSRRAALAAGLSTAAALVGRAAPVPKDADKSWGRGWRGRTQIQTES